MSNQVTVRKADSLDIPFLQNELKSTDWEQIDLNKSLVWVAEYEGKPFMFGALRLVYQLEPILKFRSHDIPKSAQKLGMYKLYKTIENYMFDPEQNKTGIYWMFAHMLEEKVYKWAKWAGWHRCYDKGYFAVRWSGSEKYKCNNECCTDKVSQS